MTLISAFGLAYLLTGLHLVYKNVASITMPLATALLFLTGAIVPLAGLPVFFTVSRFLPLAIGIDLLREIVVNDVPLMTAVTTPAFIGLLLNSAAYLAFGLLTLHWATRKARINGVLAHY